MTAVAVAALNEREPERLWPMLAGTLADLCGGDAVIHKLDEWSASEGTIGTVPDAAAAELAGLGDAELSLLRAGFPFARHYAHGTERTPVTAHRAAGAGWPGSPTARLLGEILDVDHVLGVPLPGSTTPITGCLVYRAGGDFRDDDLALAERAQPLLDAVERQRRLLEQWRRALGPAAAPDQRAAVCSLTPRETAVLLLLTDALTAGTIGRRLGISVRTVHKHVENIYRKLGTRDRVGTVLRAQRLGLVPPPGPAEARGGPW
ncbi:response regulator transcription factor [Streptomyces actinomycinicus]|uniref:Response regulator transcription factor n=2 Tax=Streptomyces actinomycinicus TaxID=1695166 RepID=A0A937EIU7_9ACTN|nr:response regulator transcription factor [Streptomyces actinomycinicus]